MKEGKPPIYHMQVHSLHMSFFTLQRNKDFFLIDNGLIKH